MDTGEKAFLEELQHQCLKDAETHVKALREAQSMLKENSDEALRKANQACHTLKANVQAVGFKSLGDSIHRTEGAIEKIAQSLASNLGPSGKPSEDDLTVLDFLLTDAFDALAGYVRELGSKLEDSPEMASTRNPAISVLECWTPTQVNAPASSTTSTTYEPAAPTPSQQAPAPSARSAPVAVVDPVATPAKEAEVKNAEIYLLCRHRDSNFAIPIDAVMEIVQAPVLETLPLKRPDLLGLINLRGEVIPVLTAMERLTDRSMHQANREAAKDSRSFIIVCQHNGLRFGLPVEQSEHIAEIKHNSLQPTAQTGANSQKEVVTHYVLRGDRTILVLNMDRMINETFQQGSAMEAA